MKFKFKFEKDAGLSRDNFPAGAASRDWKGTMSDLQKYWEIALRRKYWIIIPFLLTVLLGLGYGLTTPKIYEAETLILVLPQRVPEEYVRSIISSDIDERIRTITQQVTSRTNLERVISEFGLFQDGNGNLGTQGKVNLMRDRIRIDVSRTGRAASTSAFTIAFRHPTPELAMQVTNDLVSNFISENLKIRESQAMGTATFLSDELENVRKRLNEKEDLLQKYRENYLGAMPEHLGTNLAVLGRLQMQLDQLNSNLRDAENRKLIIQGQIAEGRERKTPEYPVEPYPPGQGEAGRNLSGLKQQLAMLEGKYTSSHPDVIRLRNTIDRLEQEEANSGENGPEGPAVPRVRNPVGSASSGGMGASLTLQLRQVNFEIENIKDEKKNVQAKMDMYQRRVDNTPKREQELASLSRDYENLKELYNSMLGRQLESDIALNMERKQKGEQFRVIDPAKIPQYPVEPDFRKIILMILALGMGLGGGVAYLVERMDTSYKTPEEVEQELKLPVMVEIPMRFSEKEIRRHKFVGIVKAASVAAGFVVLAVAIVIVTKGPGNTMQFVKRVIGDLPM